jgi:glycine cleavage system H protein
MPSPTDRRYTDSHEWILLNGDVATIGITQYAADELTDITYVETRQPGTTIVAGEGIGEVESVKTTSEVYSPVPGQIIEVNTDAGRDPSLLNSDPFGNGWLVKISATDTSSVDGLMDAHTYDEKYSS